MPIFDELPLRQRKLARTRLALLEALTARLEVQTYEAVHIKDLCAAAEISEASFFNHFERKEDLVVYFIQIWSLAVGWYARKALAERGALAAISEVFARTAADVSVHPRVMSEVIAFQARMETAPTLRDPTLAERLLAFPALAGIESVPACGLQGILPPLLAAAKSRGELPADADLDFLYLNLGVIFFGTPIVLRLNNPGAVGDVWQAQLNLLLRSGKADRAAAKGVKPRSKR